MALWIATFLISMTWLYSVHLHLYPNYWATAILAAAGIVTFALALRKKIDLSSTSPLWALLILPLAIGFAILDFPQAFGPGLLILGLPALLLCRKYARFSALAASLLISGTILTLQSLTYSLYFSYVAKDPHVPFLSSIIYPLVRFTGLRCSLSNGVIYIQTMRNNWPFHTSWASLALLPLVQMLVASAVVMPLFGGEPRKGARALWSFIMSMAYMIVRYALMLLLFTYLMYFVGYFDTDLWVTIFWNRALTALTFIPLVLIFAKAFPLRRTGETLEAGLQLEHFAPSQHLRKGLAVLAVALGVFFFVGYLGYWDSGKINKGRIILDEKHSDWEKSEIPFDITWYGNESTYNYAAMSKLLSYYYDLDKNLDKDLTKDVLEKYDILLLKNPTYPYTQEETEAILEFVEKGGGVFLMGEHTNVFGTSVPLNSIGRHFGFAFRFDSVFDMEEKFEQLWHVPKLMPGPLMQNQKDFLFATSCSIEPIDYFGPTRNAAVGPALWSLPIEYASGNFYPSVDLRTDMTYGPLVQLITATYGKGRAIGFSDSTTFSNFSTQLPGKPDLLLSSMNWLNHRNRWSLFNCIFFLLSLVFFAMAGAVVYQTPRHQGTRLAMVAVGVCVAALSMVLFTALTRSAYPMPQPKQDSDGVPLRVPKVVFEKQYSEYEIPIGGFVKDQQKSYNMFYLWTMRLGFFPFLKDNFDDALAENPQVFVMINPTNITPAGRDFVDHADAKNVEDNVIPKLKKYVEDGGKLLLMDDVENEMTMSNMILRPFGMRLEKGYAPAGRGAAPATTLLNTAGQVIGTAPVTYTVVGGDPLITTGSNKVVLARKKFGKGAVVVMGASKRFCDAQMGVSYSARPRANLMKVYFLQFAILRGLMNENPDALDAELRRINEELAEYGIR
jgi:hypothetical protein